MDFHELKAFVELSSCLHFSQAAKNLHMSPSTLSRLVGRLEAEVGTVLVLRDSRKVELSPQGLTFLEFARETLAKRDTLHLLLSGDRGTMSGTLRIYASVTACYSILPRLVEELGRHSPRLRLQVVTGDPADALDALDKRQADLALAALEEQDPDRLDCFSVGETPLVFTSRSDGPWGALHRGADGSLVWPRDRDVPLIVPHRGQARRRLDRWLKQQGIQAHISGETAGNEAILALAHLGLGLGLVPRLVLENSPFAQGLALYPARQWLGDYTLGFAMGRQGFQGCSLKELLAPLLAAAYPQGRWL